MTGEFSDTNQYKVPKSFFDYVTLDTGIILKFLVITILNNIFYRFC